MMMVNLGSQRIRNRHFLSSTSKTAGELRVQAEPADWILLSKPSYAMCSQTLLSESAQNSLILLAKPAQPICFVPSLPTI